MYSLSHFWSKEEAGFSRGIDILGWHQPFIFRYQTDMYIRPCVIQLRDHRTTLQTCNWQFNYFQIICVSIQCEVNFRGDVIAYKVNLKTQVDMNLAKAVEISAKTYLCNFKMFQLEWKMCTCPVALWISVQRLEDKGERLEGNYRKNWSLFALLSVKTNP